MPPRYLGHYRVVEKIGEGGMGIVFKAEDTKLRRPVAVKLLPEDRPDARARARLLREARSASALNHPNICTIYEVSEHEGRAFIAMEWIDGQTLRAAIPPGILHRDLKTSNIVLTGDGRPKILDFGLASRVSHAELETVTRSEDSLLDGRIAGTLAYMAPELLDAKPATVASDIWALGVLLHAMTSGELPFQAETGAAIAVAIASKAPGPLPDGAPPALRAIVERCLAKDPTARYQRPAEVRAALETVRAATSAPVPPTSRPTRPGGRRRSARIRSVAVLPLDNLSKDPAQEYFVDGMTEAMVTSLAQLGSLTVISRTSAARYRGAPKPLPEIAQALGVEGIVEGSVLRVGDRVRITAQLIHAASDTHVWANSYDRDLSDVLALHAEVADAIADEIRLKVTRRRKPVTRPRVNTRAHDLYLKGRYHWSQRKPEEFQLGFNYFNEAIEIDPGYALAYVGLADSYARIGTFHLLPPAESYPEAKAAAAKALELDPELGEAHAALAGVLHLHEWRWMEAEQAFDRALGLNPSNAEAHKERAFLLTHLGRFEKALEAAQRSRELDPLSPVMIGSQGMVCYRARDYARAIELLRQSDSMLSARVPIPAMHLGLTLVQQGVAEEAVRVLERARATVPDSPDILGVLGFAYAMAGRRREAELVLTTMNDLATRRYVSPVHLAFVHIGLGDGEQALAWLERGYRERAWLMVFLKVDPVFDPLRGDPRFQDLVRRMSFPS